MTMMISESDRAAVLDAAWQLGSVRSTDELEAAGMAVVLALLGGDESGFNDLSLAEGRLTAKIYPVSPVGEELRGQLADLIADHPVVRRLEREPSTAPVRMSDLMPDGRFRGTRTYETMFRPRGLEHQLTVPLRVDPATRSGTVYVVNRADRDFDEKDLGRAMLIAPVLAALHAAMRARTPSPESREAARVESGLTVRELDVLGLAASGMTAEAIGRALTISPRTVHKHLENAYTKLEVRGRVEAVAACRRRGLLD